MNDFTFALIEEAVLVKGSLAATVSPLILRDGEWELLHVPLCDLATTCRLRQISDAEAERLMSPTSALSPSLAMALSDSGRGLLPR